MVASTELDDTELQGVAVFDQKPCIHWRWLVYIQRLHSDKHILTL